MSDPVLGELDSPFAHYRKGRLAPRGRAISAESRVRAAKRVPEAVLKVVSWGGGRTQVGNQLMYLARDGETALEAGDGSLIQGREEVAAFLDHWAGEGDALFSGRRGARDTLHLVLSAPAGSDRERVKAAARAFAAGEFGENWERVMAAHDDTAHAHVHLLVNVHGMDGRAYRMGAGGTLEALKVQTQEMREAWASACRDQGIRMNATPRVARGLAGPSPSSGAWRAMKRGEPLRKDKIALEKARREPTRTEPSAGEERLKAVFAAEGAAYQNLAKDMRAAAARGGYAASKTRKDRTAEALAVAAEIEAFGRMAAAGEPSRAERLRRKVLQERTPKPTKPKQAEPKEEAADRTKADTVINQAKGISPEFIAAADRTREEEAAWSRQPSPHRQNNALVTAWRIRAMSDQFREGELSYAGGWEKYVHMETLEEKPEYAKYSQKLDAHCKTMGQIAEKADAYMADEYRRLKMPEAAERLQYAAHPKTRVIEDLWTKKESDPLAEDTFVRRLNELEVSERMIGGGVNREQAQEDIQALHARLQGKLRDITQEIKAVAERGKTADIHQEEITERKVDRGRSL